MKVTNQGGCRHTAGVSGEVRLSWGNEPGHAKRVLPKMQFSAFWFFHFF